MLYTSLEVSLHIFVNNMFLYIYYSNFRMVRQAFAISKKRNKSSSLDAFMSEVESLLLMSYSKRCLFFLNIYSLSLSLEDAEREYISFCKRHPIEVPYPHLQERFPVDQDCRLYLVSTGSRRGLFL